MARIATSEAGIAKADLFAQIKIAVSLGANHEKVLSLIENHPTGFAASTGSSLGGGVKARLTRYMVEAQKGRCMFCRRPLNYGENNVSNGHANALPRLFTLLPSILGADTEVSGLDAARCGMAPGNVVVTCKGCDDARNAWMTANGEALAVTEIVASHRDEVLLTWPKGTDRGRRLEDVEIRYGDDSHLAKSIRTRVANYGF
jgi:hypothetical protein